MLAPPVSYSSCDHFAKEFNELLHQLNERLQSKLHYTVEILSISKQTEGKLSVNKIKQNYK